MIQQDSRLYEAMFLVDTNTASDPEATKGMIRTVMDRANAELLVCNLWDERRLAYDVDKHKRAAYVLCYFRANGADISTMERDVQLSEHLLRVLILRADYISPEEFERIKSDSEPKQETQTPAEPSSPQQPSEDAPTEGTATKDAPTEDVPADDASTKDSSVPQPENDPAEPTSKDAPAKDAPAEEAPTEDTPDEPTS